MSRKEVNKWSGDGKLADDTAPQQPPSPLLPIPLPLRPHTYHTLAPTSRDQTTRKLMTIPYIIFSKLYRVLLVIVSCLAFILSPIRVLLSITYSSVRYFVTLPYHAILKLEVNQSIHYDLC